MARGRICLVSFFGSLGPGQDPVLSSGKQGRRIPILDTSFPRCGDTQAARGTATVWERGQTHDSICAVDSVRMVDQMAPTLRSRVRRSFPDTR